jgi:hypothetical protein
VAAPRAVIIFGPARNARTHMELALDRQRIADLKSRLDSLRRYL